MGQLARGMRARNSCCTINRPTTGFLGRRVHLISSAWGLLSWFAPSLHTFFSLRFSWCNFYRSDAWQRTTRYSISVLSAVVRAAASALNNKGQVVCSADTASGAGHAFLYSNGIMQDLGTLPGGAVSYATGINDSGQVVGNSSYTANGFDHPFLYSNGTMQDLGTLGGIDGYAEGINDSGQVVGYSETVINNIDAYVYSGGTMQSLGSFGDIATAANRAGEVVGGGYFAQGGASYAFLYSGSTVQSLGTIPGGHSSLATGVNDAGQVVGVAVPSSGGSHAFLYSGGTMKDLGTLPGDTASYARGINDAGQVVGNAYVLGGPEHAFLYENGMMVNLNGLIPSGTNMVLSWASAITTWDRLRRRRNNQRPDARNSFDARCTGRSQWRRHRQRSGYRRRCQSLGANWNNARRRK